MLNLKVATSRKPKTVLVMAFLIVALTTHVYAGNSSSKGKKFSTVPMAIAESFDPESSAPVLAVADWVADDRGVRDFNHLPYRLVQYHEAEFQKKTSVSEEVLQNLRIVLIIDHSGSQGTKDNHPLLGTDGVLGKYSHHWTRWDSTLLLVNTLLEPFFAFGPVPTIFFDSEANAEIVSSPIELEELFNKYKPSRQTNLVDALRLALTKYAPIDPNQGVLYIVVTDGEPGTFAMTTEFQQRKVKELIHNHLTVPDPEGELRNIVFVRVGDSPDAIRFLRHLDDDEAIGQNVDTKSDNMVYKMGAKNFILNSIFEHLDDHYRSEHE